MSETYTRQFHPDAGGYRVVKRDGCTLVIGPMPMTHFAALAGAAGKDAVVSTQLARLAGATFAWGSRDAVDALVRKLTEARLAVPAGTPPLSGLDRWMAVGEHGQGALAIVHKLRCYPVNDPEAHPQDPDDLRRCLLLLREAPELRGELGRMAEVSPAWDALVRSWTELEAMFVEEAGANWHERTGGWEAPRTYELMQMVRSHADALSRQGGLFGEAP